MDKACCSQAQIQCNKRRLQSLVKLRDPITRQQVLTFSEDAFAVLRSLQQLQSTEITRVVSRKKLFEVVSQGPTKHQRSGHQQRPSQPQ